jgi:hypothetical protein
MPTPEERLRILKLIEDGQVKAHEGAQLLQALDDTDARNLAQSRSRNLRIRVTDLVHHRQKISVTIPVGLIDIGVRLGARLFPNGAPQLEAVQRAIATGTTGRIFDIQDLAENERIEAFIE